MIDHEADQRPVAQTHDGRDVESVASHETGATARACCRFQWTRKAGVDARRVKFEDRAALRQFSWRA